MITIILLIFLGLMGCQCIRPIWNMGHMVNNKFQIDQFLDLGANAVETDIKFAEDGRAQYTSHGFPCDCGRDCFRWDYVEDYLDYVSYLTTPESPRYRAGFVLLNLDLKLNGLNSDGRKSALTDLARKLNTHLWKNGTSGTQVNIVIHLPSTSGIQAVQAFYNQLEADGRRSMKSKIGWEVYSDDSVESIRNMWRKTNISDNNWQGDGITNCLPRSSRRLREAVALRDRDGKTISKVYYWTVDRRSTMRDTLRLGVDGVMTNYPNRLIEVLQEPEFRGLARLATLQDNPFQFYEQGLTARSQKMIKTPDMFLNMEEGDEENRTFF